ncbi:hypothetical protein IW261DRAFT_1452359 [Armillaria novae-zelandiae]|uniref:Uncharacterized protein n=1 Tax=Armillaria novae-zelandiae TaxID=153914 RepID=A0AA39PKA1_9AGAR|nr:hypothetical protein IW261DRAFT_1452359 [Armillaria novae-zelandiae]
MTSQKNIPANLTDSDEVFIMRTLDMTLNYGILTSMLNGIYTGIFAVAMWAICSWPLLSTIFIKNGESFWTAYNTNAPGRSVDILSEAAAIASTIFADCTIIWRCWNVWGQRWISILLPVLTFLLEIAFRILATNSDLAGDFTLAAFYRLLFIIFVLITTVLCTLLIIWRVWTVVRASPSAGHRGFGAYQRIVEILAESSALYSVTLILYAGISESRDDTWKGSVSSSLRFGVTQPRNGSHGRTFVDSDVDSEGQLEENDIEPERRGSQVDESILDDE